MRFRTLRIAFSAVCGMICLLLIALWVRSYWFVDGVYLIDAHCVVSMRGSLYIDAGIHSTANFTQYTYGQRFLYSVWRYGPRITLTEHWFTVPIWMLTLISATCATLPWLHWRFSLRTLLIVMTLVAVVLGVIAISLSAPIFRARRGRMSP